MREQRPARAALHARSRAGLLALAVALCAASAPAQEPQTAPPEAPAPVTAIPVAEIGSRAQALAARVEQIQTLRPTRGLARLEAELREAQHGAVAATERAEALLTRRHNPSELEVLSRRWQRLDAAFESLDSRVGGHVETLGGVLAELAEETEAWQQTLQEAQRTSSPAVVEREIRRALDQLWAARDQVGSDLEAALALRDSVRQVRDSLSPTFEQLAIAREEFAAGLLARHDAPVWQAVPAALAELPQIGAEIAAEASAVWQEAGSYARSTADLLIAQGVVFLALAWFLSRMKARVGERAQGSEVLRHPWAAAFLISVLLVPLFQPERSRAFQLLLSPVVLLAWYRVLSPMLMPALRGPLRGLAVLMGIEIVRYVFIGVSAVDRTLLAVDLAVALSGIAWLRRPERLRLVPWWQAQSPWMRTLDGWMRLAAPALAAGLGAALLGYTSLADCIATLVLFGTVIGAGWVALVRIAETVVEPLVFEGALRRVRSIQHAPQGFLQVFRSAVRGLALLAWLYITLTGAGLWSPVRSAATALLSFPLGFGYVALSLGALLAFALTLWLSWLLARVLALLLNQELFTRVRLPPGVPFALSTLTRYAIFVVGFVVAMGTIGFTLDRVTLLLSAVGVGIGFGLQNVVNNFVSGMILLFERPIRVGDWVQLGDLFGTVTSIGIRASKMKTFDGADVVVPNADFVSERVTNWTLSDRKRRMILPVGVAYGTDPRLVMDLLEKTARDHPLVLNDPAPIALFRGFGDSALSFELRAFTAEDWLVVSSDLYVSANEALRAAGIEIPFPQRDLHLRNPEALREALDDAAGSPVVRRSSTSGS